jgi:RNA polymerase sigma-70 factor (ECF subfamily)
VSGEPERTDDSAHEAGAALLTLYDAALPQVYGYLLARCGGQVQVAQDLTAETFLAAVRAVQSGAPPDPLSAAWLVGVARHKLADHWRRQAREERKLAAVADGDDAPHDPWDVRLDALRARATLDQLAPQHRAALTLRYVDDLPVAEVATLLQRSVHATEALLSRAKAAFRRAYGDNDPDEQGTEDRDG